MALISNGFGNLIHEMGNGAMPVDDRISRINFLRTLMIRQILGEVHDSRRAIHALVAPIHRIAAQLGDESCE
jgi:hypothetical protein